MKWNPPTNRPRAAPRPDGGTFEDLTASALYCPRCRAAMPVHERLLLVLPDGELREYRCRRCLTSLGTRTTTAPRDTRIAP